MRSLRHRHLLGLVGIAVILAFVWVNVGVYRNSFSNPVMVSLETPRAGLLMQPGADVRVRGITVGSVRSVRANGNQAVLSLALDPELVDYVPSGATARIEPTSLLGGSHVRVLAPPGKASRAIRTGETIQVDKVLPDLNDVFDQVVGVLNSVRVDELSVVLSSLSRTLEGRGRELGLFISDLNRYLKALNRHSRGLSVDIKLAGPVMETYAAAAPDLLRIMRNATVTGDTLVARKEDLRTLLSGFTEVGDDGTRLLRKIEGPLLRTLKSLAPVTGLLAEYSPQFPCMLEGWSSMAKDNKSLGYDKPGAQVVMTLLPGQQGYEYTRDLPEFVDDRGPECYSLPEQNRRKPPPHRWFNDGSDVYGDDPGLTLGDPPVEFFPEMLPRGSR